MGHIPKGEEAKDTVLLSTGHLNTIKHTVVQNTTNTTTNTNNNTNNNTRTKLLIIIYYYQKGKNATMSFCSIFFLLHLQWFVQTDFQGRWSINIINVQF